MVAIIYEFNWVQYVSATTYAKLREENKTLKDNVEFLHSCLDDRDKSIQYAEEENKKLKEKIKRLEFDVDAWHQLKLLLEWEIEKLKETIKDHQLYEEKLEHRIIEFEELLHWE
jgi:predicted  nucleic acid-binding Zn-ribbon protein